MCEFEDNKTKALGYTYSVMGQYLCDNSYHVLISEWKPIVKYGVAHTWINIGEFPKLKLNNEKGWGNFIAIRSDCVNDFMKIVNLYLPNINSY